MTDFENAPDESEAPIAETALVSEAALAEDWLRPEEDEAWAYLLAPNDEGKPLGDFALRFDRNPKGLP